MILDLFYLKGEGIRILTRRGKCKWLGPSLPAGAAILYKLYKRPHLTQPANLQTNGQPNFTPHEQASRYNVLFLQTDRSLDRQASRWPRKKNLPTPLVRASLVVSFFFVRQIYLLVCGSAFELVILRREIRIRPIELRSMGQSTPGWSREAGNVSNQHD